MALSQPRRPRSPAYACASGNLSSQGTTVRGHAESPKGKIRVCLRVRLRLLHGVCNWANVISAPESPMQHPSHGLMSTAPPTCWPAPLPFFPKQAGIVHGSISELVSGVCPPPLVLHHPPEAALRDTRLPSSKHCLAVRVHPGCRVAVRMARSEGLLRQAPSAERWMVPRVALPGDSGCDPSVLWRVRVLFVTGG